MQTGAEPEEHSPQSVLKPESLSDQCQYAWRGTVVQIAPTLGVFAGKAALNQNQSGNVCAFSLPWMIGCVQSGSVRGLFVSSV